MMFLLLHDAVLQKVLRIRTRHRHVAVLVSFCEILDLLIQVAVKAKDRRHIATSVAVVGC